MPNFPDPIKVNDGAVYTAAQVDTLLAAAPEVTSASLDGTKKIVTIEFVNPVVQYQLTAAALKAKVQIATNGTSFGALGASDTVEMTAPRVMTVTFDSALTTATNKVRILADAICSPRGAKNAQYTTGALDAS